MKVTIEGTVEEIRNLLGQSVNNVVCELQTTDEFEPDWDNAPEWAEYWAVDETEEAFWYDDVLLDSYEWMCGDRGNDKSKLDKTVHLNGIDWKTTLRKRPR